jgi:hypothetical protein
MIQQLLAPKLATEQNPKLFLFTSPPYNLLIHAPTSNHLLTYFLVFPVTVFSSKMLFAFHGCLIRTTAHRNISTERCDRVASTPSLYLAAEFRQDPL